MNFLSYFTNEIVTASSTIMLWFVLFSSMIFSLSLSLCSKLIASKFRTKFQISKYHSISKTHLSSSNQNNGVYRVLALDFDGVLCASSTESSYSAIVAAKKFWPFNFRNITPDDEIKIRTSIQYLRPVIETGYENMLMARYLYENREVDLKLMEKSWTPSFRDSLLNDYQANKVDLIKTFGSTRDYLIEINLQNWIDMNPIYAPVKSFLSVSNNQTSNINLHLNPDSYIITTKQMRFVQAILNNNDIPSLPATRIFDLDNPYGSKIKVLEALTNDIRGRLQGQKQSLCIDFIEDRMETLLAVADVPTLSHVNLYLVDWGYNTESEREIAKKHARIQLIDAKAFAEIVSQFKTSI